MAERPKFHERWWAKAAVAVGAVAMSACGPNGKVSGNYIPRDYSSFGQLECFNSDEPPLSGEFIFNDGAVKTFVVYAIMQANQPAESIRIKFLGPRSSVLATNQGGGEVDVDVGVLAYGSQLVIDSVLPGIKVTADMSDEKTNTLSVKAECVE
jgi:hypothetical protein